MDEPLWTREQVEAAFAARFAPIKRATTAASSHLARTPSSGLRTQPGRRSAAQLPNRHSAVRADNCVQRQQSPQQSPRRSSRTSSHQQPAPRHLSAPALSARTSSAADSSGDEDCCCGISPPADRGLSQHQAVQAAPPAAQVFVCEDLQGGHGLRHSTADAATQAEVEHEQVHALSGGVSPPSEQEHAASGVAPSNRGTASVGVEAGKQDDAASIALPSEDTHPSDLASNAPDGRHGQRAPAAAADQTRPAHEHAAGPDPQTTLTSDEEPDVRAGGSLDGEGDDRDGAADGDSYVAPGAVGAGTDSDAALTPGELHSAVAVADNGAAVDDPLPAASFSESPAAVAQLQEQPDAEARKESYSLSEPALRDSEAQLQELAALATQLQQVRLELSGTTSAPLYSSALATSSAWLQANYERNVKHILVVCAQAVELGDDARLHSTAPTAAASDSMLSASQPSAEQRSSLENATLE